MQAVVSQALKSREEVGGISKVMYVACGGSLAAFYPAKFLLEKESKGLHVGYYPANEFVHATPAALDQNTLVIGCSHGGNTPETVEAMRIARERGAATVAFTWNEQSEITAYGDQVVKYSYGSEVIYAQKKEALGLRMAMELLQQIDGWEHYPAAMQSFDRYDRVAVQARKQALPAAKAFALANQDEPVIYTVGAGASWGSAYMECICILMEMQWIHSNCIHAGEFFHGPLEITDKQTPFLLMMGDGSTRALDERVQSFLQKWGSKLYVIDVKDLGINVLDNSVVEYFAPLLLTAVVDVYNRQLAEARQHPLSTRRYIWKVPY
jgi:fructoselysine-6-P-deglycase FrlB-like protein